VTVMAVAARREMFCTAQQSLLLLLDSSLT
jgi:hypothetical protein